MSKPAQAEPLSRADLVRLVAERVMGGQYMYSALLFADGLRWDGWNPLTSITDAWKMVDKWRSEGVMIRWLRIDETWECQIGSYASAHNPDICMAITLCCLRAVGVEGV